MPNWKVGDTIVIATTNFQGVADKFSFADESEVRKIVAISGSSITIDKPLKYRHYSGVLTVDN